MKCFEYGQRLRNIEVDVQVKDVSPSIFGCEFVAKRSLPFHLLPGGGWVQPQRMGNIALPEENGIKKILSAMLVYRLQMRNGLRKHRKLHNNQHGKFR